MAVVVPCRNEAPTITALLDAVAGQELRPDEIVVVDDASTDGTAEVIAGWALRHQEINLKLLRIGHRAGGAGAAMNTGIAETRGEIVVRVDGHSRPSAGYVRYALETLARRRAGIVGGTWHVAPGADTRTARAIAAVVSHAAGSGGVAYRHPSGAAQVERVDTVPFGCFRRSLWEELGGFDERLLGNQDYDFNYRARRAGYDVLLDRRLTSVYEARATLASLAQQYFRYGFWKLRMLRKFPSALRLRQLPPILVLPALLLAMLLALMGSAAAAGAFAAYLALVLASAAQVAWRLRDAAALPPAAAALAIVHLTWSAGFWTAVFTRADAATPRGR